MSVASKESLKEVHRDACRGLIKGGCGVVLPLEEDGEVHYHSQTFFASARIRSIIEKTAFDFCNA